MAMTYHMTPAGPKPCSASKAKCPYGDRLHGPQAEVEAKYEQDMETVASLKKRLTEAAEAYYTGADIDSPMTDDEYDAGIAYLRGMREKYDLSADAKLTDLLDGKVAAGADVLAKNASKVKHDVPMLSLEKADAREDVERYLKKMEAAGATGFKLQAKFDGIACSAVFKNGKLVQMSTRGNGEQGEDMSYLIGSSDVTVDGLPESVDPSITGEIRGELFLRPSEFRKMNEEREARGEEPFANPRNTNAGIVKRAAGGLNGDKTTLQFVMYKTMGDHSEEEWKKNGVMDATTLTEQEWEKTGMPLPGGSLSVEPGSGEKIDSITDKTMAVIDAFDPVREKTDLSLDGIVVKPLNEIEMDEKMGSNSHHPLSQIAWKYKGATAQSKVTGLEWTVGKSGKLTPTITYEAVDLDGSTCTRATVHNPAILEQMGLGVGSVIEVEKVHDILPFASQVVMSPKGMRKFAVPKHCPYCGSFIRRDERLAYCPNAKCPSRGAFMLKAAAGKGALNFDGMGASLVEALQDSGKVTTVADFYDLTAKSLAETKVGENTDGSARVFGEKRAKHVMEFIEASKRLPFHKVLPALSIPDLGPQTAKAIIKKYPSIDAIKAASVEDLATVEGIGAQTARKVKTGIEDQWPVIERMRAAGVQFEEKPAASGAGKKMAGLESQQKALGGVKISITGSVPDGYKNRGEWQEFVGAMGGEAQSGPGKDTDYLVWDGARSSAKLVKARKNGVKIISPSDFTKAMKTGEFPDHSTWSEAGEYVG